MGDVAGPAPPRRGRAPGLKVPRWTPTEDELLKQLVGIHGLKAWNTVAADLEKGGGAPLRSGTAVEQHYQILMGKRRRSGASVDKGDDTDALGAPLDAVGRAERAAEAAERAARLSEDKMLRREEKRQLAREPRATRPVPCRICRRRELCWKAVCDAPNTDMRCLQTN